MKSIRNYLSVLLVLAIVLVSVAAAQAAPWKFVVWCDTRSDYTAGNPLYSVTTVSPNTANVAAAIAREHVDFVLFPGDLAVGKKKGSFAAPTVTDMLSRWTNWIAAASPILNKFPLFLIRGNHEVSIDNAAAAETEAWQTWIINHSSSNEEVGIQPVAQQLNYKFKHKDCTFIGLDEYAPWASDTDKTTTSVDLEFLNKSLEPSANHRFVFIHQPVWYGDPSQVGPTSDAQQFTEALNGKVDFLFCGHVHLYNRVQKDGVSFQQIIAGSGGAPLETTFTAPTDPSQHSLYSDGTHYGYLLVTVDDHGNDTSVTTEFKYLNDPSRSDSAVTTSDSFQIQRNRKMQ